jgi:hypothetical protein
MSFARLRSRAENGGPFRRANGWSFRTRCDFQPFVTVNAWRLSLILGTSTPMDTLSHPKQVPAAKRFYWSDFVAELEKYKQVVDATFSVMNAAKQYMKVTDPLRFKSPFGSAERLKAERDYDEAVKDYREKAEAFATARKLYDDTRMHTVNK